MENDIAIAQNDISQSENKYIEFVKTKNNKIYYKSMYDSIQRYNTKNKEKINEKMKNRYHTNEEYRNKTLENAKMRYKKLKELKV
jgi:hypothetical protein